MTTTWLDQITAANADFQAKIDRDRLPVGRQPGPAVITCMDPRVNLAAIGIPGFGEQSDSAVRVIRTLGAMAEDRSLMVGIFLAGFKEVVVMMHTDCGCCLAHNKTDVIAANMQARLSEDALAAVRDTVGEPLADHLRDYLMTFDDPKTAVVREVNRIRSLPYIPDDLIVHGLLYTLATGEAEVIVNGYDVGSTTLF